MPYFHLFSRVSCTCFVCKCVCVFVRAFFCVWCHFLHFKSSLIVEQKKFRTSGSSASFGLLRRWILGIFIGWMEFCLLLKNEISSRASRETRSSRARSCWSLIVRFCWSWRECLRLRCACLACPWLCVHFNPVLYVYLLLTKVLSLAYLQVFVLVCP